MIGILSIAALGFFLGMRHATDPDHVIAVSTIVARHRSVNHAALIGGLWGIGHTLTILFVGGGIILFGWVIPARLGLSMEFSVGLMLILLGVLNLTGMLHWITATLLPAASGHLHAHLPANDSDDILAGSAAMPLGWFGRNYHRLGFYQMARPLVVGLVHGLAGSAAVALVVLATIRNTEWAMLYLLVFGVGTIAGMMLITGALVLPFSFSGRFSRLNSGLRVASGLTSLGFGLFLVYEIGFVSGLLTSHPQWSPR